MNIYLMHTLRTCCCPGSRRIIYLAVLTCSAAPIAALPIHTATNIYLCENAQGQKTFTDRGCLLGGKHERGDSGEPTTSRQQYAATPSSAITFAPLSREDLSRLRAQAARTAREQTERRRRKKQHNTHRLRAQVEAAKNCDQAKRALIDLHKRKRKGYRLSDAGKLDAQEARHRNERSRNC